MTVLASIEIPAAVLDAFQLRCWARGTLVEHGRMLLQDAVDELQHMATTTGLVDTLGQDAVQASMASAFEFQQKGTLMDAPPRQRPGASESYRASKQRLE